MLFSAEVEYNNNHCGGIPRATPQPIAAEPCTQRKAARHLCGSALPLTLCPPGTTSLEPACAAAGAERLGLR